MAQGENERPGLNDNQSMWSYLQSRWLLRSVTFVVWALAFASATFWALKFSHGSTVVDARLPAEDGPLAADPAKLARLLGATGPSEVALTAVNPLSRYNLLGVVAGPAHESAALIAIDGKPPKPYRVGSKIDDSYMLQSVGPRFAVLATAADAGNGQKIELPAKAVAATAPAGPAVIPIPQVGVMAAPTPQPPVAANAQAPIPPLPQPAAAATSFAR